MVIKLSSALFMINCAVNSYATAGYGGVGASGGGGGYGTYGGRGDYRGIGSSNMNTGLPYFELIIIAVILLAIVMLYVSIKKYRNQNKISSLLKQAEIRDQIWNEAKLKDYMAKRFIDIQTAWSKMSFEDLQLMLTPILYEEWQIKLIEMKNMSVRNIVEVKEFGDINIVNIKDYINDELDEFIAEINYRVKDVYTNNNNSAFDMVNFEYWRMQRDGDEWRLSEIQRDGVLTKFSIGLENPIFEREWPNKR